LFWQGGFWGNVQLFFQMFCSPQYWLELIFPFKDLYQGGPPDRIFYAPQTVGTWGIFYWKNMYPDGFPQTLEQLYVEADRLNEAGIVPIGAGCSGNALELYSVFVQFVKQLDPGGEMLAQANAGEISWVNDTFREAMQHCLDLYQKGVFPKDILALPYAAGGGFEMFLNKRAAAFWLSGTFFVSSLPYGDLTQDNVGWDYIPAIDENHESIALGGMASNMAVNPKSEHLEIALDILKFTNSPEAQPILFENLTLPITKVEGSSGVPLLDAMLEAQVTKKITYGYDIANSVIATALFNEMNELYLGRSIDDVLEAVQKVSEENQG